MRKKVQTLKVPTHQDAAARKAPKSLAELLGGLWQPLQAAVHLDRQPGGVFKGKGGGAGRPGHQLHGRMGRWRRARWIWCWRALRS